MSLFLHKNVSSHTQNHEGQSAVHLASSGGHLAVLEILLKYGAKANIIDTAGYTPLHYAVQGEALDLHFAIRQ
jgi:ankyrin repeat protein